MKKATLISILVLCSLCASCNFPPPQANSTITPPPPATEKAQPPKTSTPNGACPAYTPITPDERPQKDARQTVIEAFTVTAPSGNALYGQIRRPDPALYPCQQYAAVILVPGGINPGRMMAHGGEAQMLAEAGMVVVTFNAEGRVDTISDEDIRSEGTEDFNGFRQQDGLCAIVQYVMDLPYVTAENVGLRSQSYGITMAAGCAARHPELPIKYIVDGEGPPDSYVTTHEPRATMGDLQKFQTVHEIFGRSSLWRDPSPENEAFWKERESIRFIGDFRGRYLRLQAEWDHAQPPETQADVQTYFLPDGPPEGGLPWWQGKHTTDIVNAAVQGGVPWVRVNLPEHSNPVNATYDVDHFPRFLPGHQADKPWAVRAVLEMARESNE
ncbi:MAG: hypothetical protein MAG431_00746 [Chloroflexi bacterium]|nr:hypothetical protein [Chloroflexota bacterium]